MTIAFLLLGFYAQITKVDNEEAAKMTILNVAEKDVYDPVYIGAYSPCTELNKSDSDFDITPKEHKKSQQKNSDLQLYANCRPVGRVGFEPT